MLGIQPPEPRVTKNIFQPQSNLFQVVDEVEIARQLTLIEFHMFTQITPNELLNKLWLNEDTKYKVAPHVVEMRSRFQDVANWTAITILTAENKPKSRAKVMEKFIKIAENLKILKNYQTLYAILNGLNYTPVTRLTLTFAEITTPKVKETLQDLNNIMSPDSDRKNYRDLMIMAGLPCIPYLEILLSDIFAIEDMESDFMGEKLINIEKQKRIYTYLTTIQAFQKHAYNLHPVQQIAAWLNRLPKTVDSEMLELSYKAEPKK